MRRLLLGLLPLLLVACAAPRHTAPRPGQLHYPPLQFKLPQVDQLVLPNGIHLYLKQDHELPLVAVTGMFAAGSIDDPAAEVGRSDLFASLLRTGGAGERTPEEVDALLAYYAINFSVHADDYATSLDLSLRSADLPRALGLLADVLRRPRFDAGRLELARRQAQEAVRRQDDDPAAIARRTLMAALYPDHPFGRSASHATLAAISRDDLLATWRQRVQPGNLWLAVTGDFDREQLLASLRQLFGDWQPAPAAQSAQSRPSLKPSLPAAIWLADKDVPQTTILFGQLGISKDNPDLYALRVMNYILGGGGFNSRLMREIRSNRGLAYSVYSYYRIGRYLPGPFVAGCETKSGSTIEVLKLMQAEMERLRREKVSDRELQLARESLINSFVFAFTDTHDVVTQAMRLDYYGYPPDYLQSYRDKLAAVTADDVLRVARKYLDPSQQAMVLVGNPKAFDGSLDGFGRLVHQVAEPR